MRVQIRFRVVTDDGTIISDDEIACFDRGMTGSRTSACRSGRRRSANYTNACTPRRSRRRERN